MMPRSSRLVNWGGVLVPRKVFEPGPDLPQGTCLRCGGLGVVPECIDVDRYDDAVPCPECRMFCVRCQRWVNREGHECR